MKDENSCNKGKNKKTGGAGLTIEEITRSSQVQTLNRIYTGQSMLQETKERSAVVAPAEQVKTTKTSAEMTKVNVSKNLNDGVNSDSPMLDGVPSRTPTAIRTTRSRNSKSLCSLEASPADSKLPIVSQKTTNINLSTTKKPRLAMKTPPANQRRLRRITVQTPPRKTSARVAFQKSQELFRKASTKRSGTSGTSKPPETTSNHKESEASRQSSEEPNPKQSNMNPANSPASIPDSSVPSRSRLDQAISSTTVPTSGQEQTLLIAKSFGITTTGTSYEQTPLVTSTTTSSSGAATELTTSFAGRTGVTHVEVHPEPPQTLLSSSQGSASTINGKKFPTVIHNATVQPTVMVSSVGQAEHLLAAHSETSGFQGYPTDMPNDTPVFPLNHPTTNTIGHFQNAAQTCVNVNEARISIPFDGVQSGSQTNFFKSQPHSSEFPNIEHTKEAQPNLNKTSAPHYSTNQPVMSDTQFATMIAQRQFYLESLPITGFPPYSANEASITDQGQTNEGVQTQSSEKKPEKATETRVSSQLQAQGVAPPLHPTSKRMAKRMKKLEIMGRKLSKSQTYTKNMPTVLPNMYGPQPGYTSLTPPPSPLSTPPYLPAYSPLYAVQQQPLQALQYQNIRYQSPQLAGQTTMLQPLQQGYSVHMHLPQVISHPLSGVQVQQQSAQSTLHFQPQTVPSMLNPQQLFPSYPPSQNIVQQTPIFPPSLHQSIHGQSMYGSAQVPLQSPQSYQNGYQYYARP